MRILAVEESYSRVNVQCAPFLSSKEKEATSDVVSPPLMRCSRASAETLLERFEGFLVESSESGDEDREER